MGEMMQFQAAGRKDLPRLSGNPQIRIGGVRICVHPGVVGAQRPDQEDRRPSRRSRLPRSRVGPLPRQGRQGLDEASHMMVTSIFPMPPSKTSVARAVPEAKLQESRSGGFCMGGALTICRRPRR